MSDDWTLSASKLKSFDECEEKFRLGYIEGYDEMGPDNRWIRRGNAVHEAAESVLRESSDPSITSDVLKDAYRANGGQTAYKLSDDFHQQVLRSLETVARFCRDYVDEIRDIEAEVEFGVNHATIPRDFGGFIDVASGTDVIDWKTGKSEGKDMDETIQGAVYMGGYTQLYGEPPEAVRFVYVNPEAGDDHPKVVTMRPDDDAWDAMIGRARSLMSAVQSDEYVPNPGDPCTFCDYEVFCSYSPVGAGGIDWESYP